MIPGPSRPARENRRRACYDPPVMQRAFVTGATGFVGRNLIRALLANGFLVR